MWNTGVLSVGVGGSRSGVGKTRFIEKLIQELRKRNFTVVAVKFSESSRDCQIFDEDTIILKKGKDTERYAKAGAQKVFLVKSSRDYLPELLPSLKREILRIASTSKRFCTIFEGNSLVKAVKPDVIIFIKDTEVTKPSGHELQRIADFIIDSDFSVERVMERIEGEFIKREIERKLRENSADGKITCAQARAIAEELGVPYIEVGRVANQLKIKIRKCELGCF